MNLLDINVLLALCDESHEFHEEAWRWFLARRGEGWVTCPLTENGFVRILGHPAHPSGVPSIDAAREILIRLCSAKEHAFWPDHLSLRDRRRFDKMAGATSKSLTDLYLLALAVAKRGRFITFDQRISAASVPGGSKSLEILKL